MVREFLFTIFLTKMNKVSEFMKDNGLMTRKMAQAFNDFQMVPFITAIIETVNLTVGESSQITKDKFMKDNGEMV